MKKMKKFMSLMLSLVMCGSLCTAFIGCDEGDEKEPDTNTENPGGENPDKPEGEVAHVAVTLPSWVTEFQANSGEQGETEKEKEFFVTKKSYKVGDDNPFIFKPSVECYAEGWEEEVATPADADFSYQVEVKGEDSAWTVDETMIDASTTVTKDGKFDFSENAIGKTLRLTVTPDINGVTDAESVSFEFEVVDGYNAYNDYDLSYISNYSKTNNLSGVGNGDDEPDNQYAWEAFREAKGLTLNPNDINAIIMHRDISLTKASFPEIFFYTAADLEGTPDAEYYVGSLKDQKDSGLYYRELENDKSFAFYGNYFSLDVSAVPAVLMGARNSDYASMKATFDDNGNITASDIISHATLMRIYAKEGDGWDKNKTSALVTDVDLRGNAAKSNGFKAQGGLIFLKTGKSDCTVDNVISHSYFITAMAQTVNTKATLNNMKCFDTFNSPIYNYGCEAMKMDNILIRNTGGPAIIADAYTKGSSTASPCIEATNFVFDNQLTGDENWFVMAGANNLIPEIRGIGRLLKSQDIRSFVKADEKDENVSWLKPICVVKDDGDKVRFEKNAYHPYININGNIMDFGAGAAAYNKTGNDAIHNYVLADTLNDYAVAQGAPVLETTGGGLVATDTKDLYYPKYLGRDAIAQLAPGYTTTVDKEKANMSKGDCINLYYYNSKFCLLGVMFELYE